MTNEEKAKIFKAFCDANRLTILELLKNGEKCACELLEVMPIEQPTLSHHMKILCESNIVMMRKVGKSSYYILNEIGLGKARLILEELKDFSTKTSACATNY